MKRFVALILSMFLLCAVAIPSWGSPIARADESVEPGPAPTAPQEGGGGAPAAEPGVAMNPSTGQSVPRVMLTAFATDPDVVQAGESFTVHFTVQNMSKRTRVENLKVTLSGADGAFLPAAGSSSTYISSIKAEGSVSRSMEFASLPSLEDRPYQMTLSVEYEDAEFNQYSSQETVSVVISQAARADASEPQVMPSDLLVGQDASVMFNVNNLGKSKMFNVRASLDPVEGLSTPDAFVGTIEPGASGNVEMLIHADGLVTGPAKILITYEDAEGKVTTIDKPLTLTVTEDEAMGGDMVIEEQPVDEPEGGLALSPIVLAVGLGILLLASLVLLLVLRSRKKRRERQALEEDMQLLDDTLVPPGQ